MTEPASERRRPPLTRLISSGLVVAGLALGMFVSMGFLIVSGVGAFGPGILRELGLLRDEDEFQREARYRAGYLAYLAGGFVAVLAIAVLRWDTVDLDGGAVWVALVLAVLWLTWLFSSLLAYWGARKTASRVLVAFGAFWGIFVLGHLGEPVALIMEALFFVAPFFLLAWAAGRWPRAAGALLLAIAAFIFWRVFDLGRQFVDWPSQVLTFTLLLVPMLACGIALLREGAGDDE